MQKLKDHSELSTPKTVIIQPGDKITVMSHQIITPNEKEYVIIQPDYNIKENVIQPDDKIYVIR